MADKENLFVAVTSLERLLGGGGGGGVFIFTAAVSVSRDGMGAIAPRLLQSVGDWERSQQYNGVALTWLPESFS